MSTTRIVVIGGGIVGTAVAHHLATTRPGAAVTLIEKERELAAHQTGRNSGVIHAGVYYPPGSLKAEFCRAGGQKLTAFADQHGIDYRICGKLVVATDESELPALRRLVARAQANGLAVQEFSAEQAREREPHVNCVAALYSPSSGIIDYAEVTRVLAREAVRAGADFRLGNTVQALSRKGSRTLVSTDSGDVVADVLINCAGLHSDRIARLAGLNPQSRIVPFRGEYFELTASRAELVRGLIYPVPNPDLPFLGVHLTASIHGGVHAGPNAVPALAREGYDWRTIRARDIGESLTHPGFWKLARTHAGSGVVEIRRSLSRKRFAASLATLVPGITAADLVAAPAGVRAQAIDRDGKLVDDFLIESAPGQVHVLNAPSPAATCSLQIAEHIAGLVPDN